VPGLQAALRAHGDAGLVWLLERLAAAPPERRARPIAVLAAFDQREAWQALLALLADTTRVPNPRAAAQAPPGYADLRVCDHALRALAPRLRPFPLPAGIEEWRVDPLMPLGVRDKRVAAARAAAAAPPVAEHLAARPSVREAQPADPALVQRLGAALERLGVH
jgi:hypothetical protein